MRSDWKRLQGKQKLQYIWDYYKLVLVVICIALYAITAGLHGYLTKKETQLTVALVNVSVGDTLARQLTDDFLQGQGADVTREMVALRQGLVITDTLSAENNMYVESSRAKITAMIDAQQLDIVLMNEEAYHAFGQSGYLYDLTALLQQDATAYAQYEKFLRNGTQDSTWDAVGQAVAMDISSVPIIKAAGFGTPVYLGVIANTQHTDAVIAYLQYLFSADKGERHDQ